MQLIFKYMTSQTATRKRKSTGKLETIAWGKSKPEKFPDGKRKQCSRRGKVTSSPTSPVAAGENSRRSDHRLRRPAGRRRRRIPPKLETFPGPNPSKTRAFRRTSPPLSNNVISPTHFSLSSSLSPSRIPERERGRVVGEQRRGWRRLVWVRMSAAKGGNSSFWPFSL